MPPKRQNDSTADPPGVYVSAVPINTLGRTNSNAENRAPSAPTENASTLALLQQHSHILQQRREQQPPGQTSQLSQGSPARPPAGAVHNRAYLSPLKTGQVGVTGTPAAAGSTITAASVPTTPGSAGGVRSRRKPTGPIGSPFLSLSQENQTGQSKDEDEDEDHPPRARDAAGLVLLRAQKQQQEQDAQSQSLVRQASGQHKSIFDIDAESDIENVEADEDDGADAFSFGGVKLNSANLGGNAAASSSLSQLLPSSAAATSNAIDAVIAANVNAHLTTSGGNSAAASGSLLDPKAIAVLFRDIADGFDAGVVAIPPSSSPDYNQMSTSSSTIKTSADTRTNRRSAATDSQSMEASSLVSPISAQSFSSTDSLGSTQASEASPDGVPLETPGTATVLMTLSNEIRDAVRLFPPPSNATECVRTIEKSRLLPGGIESDEGATSAFTTTIVSGPGIAPKGPPEVPSLTTEHRVALNREAFVSNKATKGGNKAKTPASGEQQSVTEESLEADTLALVEVSNQARMQDLKLASHDDFLAAYVKTARNSETSVTSRALRGQYRLRFAAWRASLANGFHLMLHGLGSKQTLLQNFIQSHLSDGPVVQIYGYGNAVNLKKILTELDEVVLKASAAGQRYIEHSLEAHARRLQKVPKTESRAAGSTRMSARKSQQQRKQQTSSDAQSLDEYYTTDPLFASALSVLMRYQAEVMNRIEALSKTEESKNSVRQEGAECALALVEQEQKETQEEKVMPVRLGVRRGRAKASSGASIMTEETIIANASPSSSPTKGGRRTKRVCQSQEGEETGSHDDHMDAEKEVSVGVKTVVDALVKRTHVSDKLNTPQSTEDIVIENANFVDQASAERLASIRSKLTQVHAAIAKAIQCPSGDIEDGPAGKAAAALQIPPFVYIVIHSIDGPAMRKPQNINIISRLSQIPGIRLVASVDHNAFRLIWNDLALNRSAGPVVESNESGEMSFVRPSPKWISDHVPTFESYAKELAGADSGVVLLNSSVMENRKETLRHTLESLTRNHKALLALLAARQVETLQQAESEETKMDAGGKRGTRSSRRKGSTSGDVKMPSGNEGMTVNEWLEAAWDDMLIASDEGFKKLVRELEEQGLVSFHRGTGKYYIPYSLESVQQQILQ